MQSISSRIWTRVTVSISYDNNHYTTGTSKKSYVMTDGRNQKSLDLKEESIKFGIFLKL